MYGLYNDVNEFIFLIHQKVLLTDLVHVWRLSLILAVDVSTASIKKIEKGGKGVGMWSL